MFINIPHLLLTCSEWTQKKTPTDEIYPCLLCDKTSLCLLASSELFSDKIIFCFSWEYFHGELRILANSFKN